MPPSLFARLAALRPTQWPLPGGCWVCRAWGWARVCEDCRRAFAAPRARCPRCALPCQAPLCGHCLLHPLPLDAVHAWADYVPPWSELLHALKYEGALGLAPALAEGLQAPPGALLLPVPLHPARLGARGHNQSALLAQALGHRLGLAVDAQAMRRVVDTPTQTRLGRAARLKNLRHAFELAPNASVRGRHCVLVDDVMTTGATLATLAALLRQQGAARVEATVVARTPDPSDP